GADEDLAADREPDPGAREAGPRLQGPVRRIRERRAHHRLARRSARAEVPPGGDARTAAPRDRATVRLPTGAAPLPQRTYDALWGRRIDQPAEPAEGLQLAPALRTQGAARARAPRRRPLADRGAVVRVPLGAERPPGPVRTKRGPLCHLRFPAFSSGDQEGAGHARARHR